MKLHIWKEETKAVVDTFFQAQAERKEIDNGDGRERKERKDHLAILQSEMNYREEDKVKAQMHVALTLLEA